LEEQEIIILCTQVSLFSSSTVLTRLQAITEMVRELRKGKARNGLVLANGGMVTYQYVVCLSNKPRDSPYPESNPLPDLLEDEEVPKVDEKAEGEAVIEVSFVS
jgi:hypothetical protein